MNHLFRTKTVVAFCAVALAAASSFGAETNQTRPDRPPSWARKITVRGVKNCYQVTTNLYRGAQPTAAGMAQLKTLGVKTVINLRSFHLDKDEAAGTGLRSLRFGTEPWRSDEQDVVRFLRVVSDPDQVPVFVHCRRGADRTGMMCAIYRVAVCGWSKEDAIEEMKNGGFGFNPVWKNLVTFVEKANIADLKRKAGMTPNAGSGERQ